MQIKNKTKGTIVAEDTSVCRTIWSQMRGLMFSRKKNLFFIFKNEKAIILHMFFVFFPIDIIYLNKKMQVLDIKQARPFQPRILPSEKAKYIIELPLGNLKESLTEIGDILKTSVS